MKYPHPAWIEIDLGQFKNNVALIRKHIGKRLFCLPVKANAYGHGLRAISHAAVEAGIDYLGVAHLAEGIQLRQENIAIPILVLGAIHEDQIASLIDFDLEFTISSKFKADLVAKRCENLKKKCRVHLEVDTGMQRTGVRCSTAKSLYEHLKRLECFSIVGVYSHLASSDHPNDPIAQNQIATFSSFLRDPIFAGEPLIRHMANSGGNSFFPDAHLDMVRPSLLSFGYIPDNAPHSFQEIHPCFSLKAKVSYFKVVEAKQGIGYGHTHITSKQTRIVTIPVGYGDGYLRSLSNQSSVLIRGKKYPIVGAICMDQFMVDVGQDEVYVGDEVVLIGKQGSEEITLTDIAKKCGTIPYEILCLFNNRLPRLYL